MGALNRSVVAPLSSAIITVMLAGVVVVGVDSVDKKVREGTARLDPIGVVEVSVDGAPFVRASHGRTLGANDQVRVIDGRATLELPHSSKAELRSGSVLTMAAGPTQPEVTLDEGDLLIETGRGDTLSVDGGTSVVSVAGSAKLRRGVSLAAGVYEGTARLQRNEQALTVPQYRQAAVVGTGILPQAPDPLGLSASDDWDRRLLGRVIAADAQLTIFAQSFEAEVPTAAATPDLFKTVAPRLADLPITPDVLGGRAPGENLIGLTLVALDKGDFLSRFQRIFGFRAQGASWGLVAADRGINPNPVLDDLESALGNLHPGSPGDLALPVRGRHAGIGGRFGVVNGGSIGGSAGGTSPGAPGSTGGGSGSGPAAPAAAAAAAAADPAVAAAVAVVAVAAVAAGRHQKLIDIPRRVRSSTRSSTRSRTSSPASSAACSAPAAAVARPARRRRRPRHGPGCHDPGHAADLVADLGHDRLRTTGTVATGSGSDALPAASTSTTTTTTTAPRPPPRRPVACSVESSAA